jgi:hypothetical protein
MLGLTISCNVKAVSVTVSVNCMLVIIFGLPVADRSISVLLKGIGLSAAFPLFLLLPTKLTLSDLSFL